MLNDDIHDQGGMPCLKYMVTGNTPLHTHTHTHTSDANLNNVNFDYLHSRHVSFDQRKPAMHLQAVVGTRVQMPSLKQVTSGTSPFSGSALDTQFAVTEITA